jgi:orotate phosphoribosyltransferase
VNLAPLLEQSGAILRGHFILTSGRHSDVYFEKFRVLERPDVLTELCQEIAKHFADSEVQYVAGPTTGGIIVAFEVARQMELESVYIETEDGKKTLRRNKQLVPGAKCLIVDDVLTTGRSLIESRQAIERAGGTPIAYAVLIDRSPEGLDLGLPLFGAYKVAAESYASDDIPEWLQAIEPVKPGTRK